MPTTTTTTVRNDQGFSTQVEAERAAREMIWGDVTFAKRGYVHCRTHPDVAVAVSPRSVIAVSANVNGHLVVFTFDGYGRRDQKPLVLR